MITKKKYLKIFASLVFLVVLIFIIVGIVYVITPYKASTEIQPILEKAEVIKVDKTNLYYFEGNQPASNQGYVIYPGGRVEAGAYSGLCNQLAIISSGCVIVEMPLNFAFLPHIKLSKTIQNTQLNNKKITVIGHSLGGPFLARDLLDSDIENLYINRFVLLGSFSDVDVSDLNVQTFSFIGENDLLIKDNDQENKDNLPANTNYYIVEGGNHASWGDYGNQSGDGDATISNKQQQLFLIEKLLNAPQ